MKNCYKCLALFFGLMILAGSTWAQSKSVSIKQAVKELEGRQEFLITWNGGDYKQTYYEVKSILDGAEEVEKQVFLYKLSRISVIVREEWSFEGLKALFESHGFDVIYKPMDAARQPVHH